MLSKCAFQLEEVQFLGHVTSAQEIAMDPAKIDVVLKQERVTTVIKVRSFVGLAGYDRRFVEGFSMIVGSLTQLTRKDQIFVWIDKCETIFEEMKKNLTYASRQLKVHEKNYLIHDMELVAVMFTLKTWRLSIWGVF